MRDAFWGSSVLLQFSLIGQLVASLGLGALVVIGYGIVLRKFGRTRSASYASAVVFSCGALAAMVNPIELHPGIVFDARAVFIALSVPFGGPVAGFATGGSAGVFRLWMGGEGAVAGMTGILIAAAAGFIFYWLGPKKQTAKSLFVLGLLAACMVFSIFLLGFDAALPVFVSIVMPLTLINVGGVIMLGYVLESTRQADHYLRSVEFKAERDPLTNLWNRHALTELSARMENPVTPEEAKGCVILFDIDHFKSINDRFGHPRGDIVLLTIARTILSRVRRSDMVVRYGGEEIAVVLMNAPVEGASRIAEQIRKLIADERFEFEGQSFSVTISAGVAEFQAPQMRLNQALDFADRALYKAKNTGRNCVQVETMRPEAPIAAANS